jgi:hypothetical protein
VARETVSRNASLTIFICAEKWLITMSMHGVGFAFVPKETGCG